MLLSRSHLNHTAFTLAVSWSRDPKWRALTAKVTARSRKIVFINLKYAARYISPSNHGEPHVLLKEARFQRFRSRTEWAHPRLSLSSFWQQLHAHNSYSPGSEEANLCHTPV